MHIFKTDHEIKSSQLLYLSLSKLGD